MQASSRRPARGWLIASLFVAILSATASLSLAACAGGRSAATPTPTRTPRPTFTPIKATATAAVAIAVATATPLPSPTAAPPTPTAPLSPTAPPTAAPTATSGPTAVPPTAAPRPAATAAPPTQPPVADPCANIGGDGCKWRVTGGPAFGANGGSEIKLQLLFIHSGIDGGQPQGSYFIVLEKDGQNLKIPDSVRSISDGTNQGPLGKYNYEYALGLDRLGGTITGNYTLWVLDGNGERDSRNVTFSVPAGQGQIWIQFDQS